MMNRLFTVALAFTLPLMSAPALADYQHELLRLDSQAQAFAMSGDYVMVDADSLTGDTYYSADHFPALTGAQGSIHWPDADLDALTRAVLLLDAREGPLPHVRYRLRYSMNASPDYPELQHDYVEVTRFNLGPERRRDLLDYVAEEHVADAAQFGIGPHVSWRFALAPVMGMRAGLMVAARREVSDKQARAMDCLDQSCLSLVDAEGPPLDWNPMASPDQADVPYRGKSPLGSTRAAAVVQELWAALSAFGMDPLPYKPDQPQFIFVASIDVGGQDASAHGMVQQAVVMDHSVQEIWTRRDEAGGSQAAFAQMYVPRR